NAYGVWGFNFTKTEFAEEFYGRLGGKDKLTDLVRATLHNIAFPEKTFQGNKGTCVAAACETLLAIHDPASYIRAVRELAGRDGLAKLSKDVKLTRAEGTTVD